MKNTIPRSEHPRPDRQRENWLCLNGLWDFEIDNAKNGIYRQYYLRPSLEKKILVPFCPESKLSGVGETDFMNAVWYRRNFDIPESMTGKRIILHIDACDYETNVYINGKYAGNHLGGYTPFEFDITDLIVAECNYITLYVQDDIRSTRQISGKQSHSLDSYGCFYTRTTGIWQSVWLEAVPDAYIKDYRVYPNISDPSVTLSVRTSRESVGAELKVAAFFDGKAVGEASAVINSCETAVTVNLSEKHLWKVGEGNLYTLKFTLAKDSQTDEMSGYFGLREVALTKEGLKINGETVFGRFVLDQGFYPDGIYTAPTDEALIFDIEASMQCGFNGARLHQKVFEPRFLYHADRLGYMVWAECGNWGLDHTDPDNIYNFLPEWLEEVERDFSHPSVIGWCPFNETWDIDGRRQSNKMIDLVYMATKSIDNTRPTITNSGSFPVIRTDAHDVHDYEQDADKFSEYYSQIKDGIIQDPLYRTYKNRQKYDKNLPVFVSEYGGIKWALNKDASAWGYGKDVKSEYEFFERLRGLTDVMLSNPYIFGFCYTQLYDVEQEQNGLLTYDREFKFSKEKFYAVFSKKAVIENN